MQKFSRVQRTWTAEERQAGKEAVEEEEKKKKKSKVILQIRGEKEDEERFYDFRGFLSLFLFRLKASAVDFHD